MTSSGFDEFDRTFERMDRAVSDLRRRMRSGIDAPGGRFDGVTGGLSRGCSREGLLGGSVHARLSETDDGYRLVADVPGFETGDIDLTVDDGVLALSAVREVEEGNGVHVRRVNERVTLPADADAEGASASYRNGVLEVEIPVLPGAESGTRIDVE